MTALDLGTLRLCGHLAVRGDVGAAAGEWLGGPELPSRIEGFAVEWPGMPADLAFGYAVRSIGPDRTHGAPAGIGQFVGTRGRGLPLTGVVFEIGGSRSRGLVIVAEAAFLAAARVRAAGRRVSLAGPSGREPLVGLRLTLAAAPLSRVAP